MAGSGNNRIAELRKNQGWSQSVLAKQIGVAQNTVSQYENGLRDIPTNIVLKLATLFEVTPSYLLGWDAPSGGKGIDIGLASIDIADGIGVERLPVWDAIVALAKANMFSVDLLSVLHTFPMLNKTGQKEAAKRVMEMAELTKYRRPDDKEEPHGFD